MKVGNVVTSRVIVNCSRRNLHEEDIWGGNYMIFMSVTVAKLETQMREC